MVLLSVPSLQPCRIINISTLGPICKRSLYFVVLRTYLSSAMLEKRDVAHAGWLRTLYLSGLRFLYGHK